MEIMKGVNNDCPYLSLSLNIQDLKQQPAQHHNSNNTQNNITKHGYNK